MQRPFKAKPVPAHVHEAKYEAMMAAHEAAKTAAKVKAEMAKERVAKALEEDQARRYVCLCVCVCVCGSHGLGSRAAQ